MGGKLEFSLQVRIFHAVLRKIVPFNLIPHIHTLIPMRVVVLRMTLLWRLEHFMQFLAKNV